jgi:hypothetical protein
MNKIHYSWLALHTHLSMDSDGHISQCSGCIGNSVCFEEFSIADTQSIGAVHRKFSIIIKMDLLQISFGSFVFLYLREFVRKRLKLEALIRLLTPFLFLDIQDSFLIIMHSKKCLKKRKRSSFVQVGQDFKIKNHCFHFCKFLEKLQPLEE